MKLVKKNVLENFKNIKNNINFKFLVCSKRLFNKEGIINNYGFYLIFVIMIFHIITILIFSLKQLSLLKKRIENISIELQSVIQKPNEVKKDEQNKNQFDINEISIYKRHKKRNKKKKYINQTKHMNESNTKLNSKIKMNNNDKIENMENIKNYIDEEINGLSYIYHWICN